jgi:hypothetical protein
MHRLPAGCLWLRLIVSTSAGAQVNNVRDFNEEDYMDGDLMDEELVE